MTNMLAEYKKQLESDEGKEALKLIKQDDKLTNDVIKECEYLAYILSDLFEQFRKRS